MGFLRRDFGATGLFVMDSQGLLTARQFVVSMVTITLFIPCFASVMMIARERGYRIALGLTVLIFPFAFLVGGLQWLEGELVSDLVGDCSLQGVAVEHPGSHCV